MAPEDANHVLSLRIFFSLRVNFDSGVNFDSEVTISIWSSMMNFQGTDTPKVSNRNKNLKRCISIYRMRMLEV